MINMRDVSVQQVMDTFKSNIITAKKVIKNIINIFEGFCDPNDPALKSLDESVITHLSYFDSRNTEKLKCISNRFFSK